MIHLSEQCHTGWTHIQQVIVKSYGQHTYLEEAMKSSQLEFYAKASLSSQVLCPKHYISMYLGEYPVKLWLSCEIKFGQKNTPTP